MSTMLPGEVAEVLGWLGFTWPLVDEDKVDEVARAWRDWANDIEHVIGDTTRIAAQVAAENRGESIDAFTQRWGRLGGSGHLREAVDASRVVAEVLSEFAAAVRVTKGAVIVQLGITAAELVAAAAGAIVTFGLSTAAGAAAIVAGRIAIRRIIEHNLLHIVTHQLIPRLKNHVGELFTRITRGAQEFLEHLAESLRRTVDRQQLARAGAHPGDREANLTHHAGHEGAEMATMFRRGHGSAESHPRPMSPEDRKLVESLPSQVHHFATDKNMSYTKKFKKIADRYGLDLDDRWNRELLPHRGRHPREYHDFVELGMHNAAREARGDRERFLTLYEDYVKDPVRTNPMMLRKDYWR